MTRVWVTLAGIVFVVGMVRTAYAYGQMVANEEYNSAPSGVAFVYLVPYAFVSVLLLIPVLVSRHRRLNPRKGAADTVPVPGANLR